MILAVPGLVMILISAVWTIAGVQIPIRGSRSAEPTETNHVPSGKVRCPSCGMEVEVLETPEFMGRSGEVRFQCPHCGKRI